MKHPRLDRSTLKLPLALSGGRTASLADYAGRWLVLYFYPKDSTPGCTTEGLDFNALLPRFHELGAEVLGVSRFTRMVMYWTVRLFGRGNYRE